MADWLLSMAEGEAAAAGVTMEVPCGPVVESLKERGFVVHSINEKQLDRSGGPYQLRGWPTASSTSGAKSFHALRIVCARQSRYSLRLSPSQTLPSGGSTFA